MIFLVCISVSSNIQLVQANISYKPKKFNNGECEAAMKYLSNIWNIKDNDCSDNRTIAGIEIANLIEKDSCFLGKPFKKIEKYLGKPDLVNGLQLQYDILNHKEAHYQGWHISSIIFELNSDSVITGFSTGNLTTDY